MLPRPAQTATSPAVTPITKPTARKRRFNLLRLVKPHRRQHITVELDIQNEDVLRPSRFKMDRTGR